MHYQLYIKRKEARLKQKDIASVLNINNATYSLKENGKADFSLTEALKLANHFNCTLDDLFWEEDVI